MVSKSFDQEMELPFGVVGNKVGPITNVDQLIGWNEDQSDDKPGNRCHVVGITENQVGHNSERAQFIELNVDQRPESVQLGPRSSTRCGDIPKKLKTKCPQPLLP